MFLLKTLEMKVANMETVKELRKLKLPALEQVQSLPAEFDKLGLRAGEIILSKFFKK
jgi:hypothetical protein